jgi:FkbM family methyltransferase
MWVNLSDRSVSFPCLQGDYEPNETRLVRTLLQSGQTFVDIGANIGWFSVLAAAVLREEGFVYSFEPRPDTYEHLSATMALADMKDRAFTFQVGLADQAGSMNLTWGEKTPNPGGSRLIHGDIEFGQEGVMVELRTLDSFALSGCDLIKIDVEGAEMIALRGGRQTIVSHRPTILSEVHDGQLKSVSRCSASEYVEEVCGLGYQCLKIETGEVLLPSAFHQGGVVNVVFVPVERVPDTRRLMWGA